MLATLLQVPFIVLLYYQNRISKEEESRHGFALQKKAEITAKLDGLKETEVQLGQIKSWEPILRGRMPASAFLGAVEQTIPRDVVLSRLALEAADFRPVSLGYGFFGCRNRIRSPWKESRRSRTRGLGEIRWQILIEASARKPCGEQRREQRWKESDVLNCKAVLQAQANGNYFPLGVNKIDTDENL